MKTIAIVHHVGERTHELVLDFCEKALGKENVHVIPRHNPAEAFMQICQISQTQEADWVLVVDGGMIPRAGFIQDIIDAASNTKKKTAYIQGRTKDKYLGPLLHQPSGPILYSREALALFTEETEFNSGILSPQTQAHKFLAHKGWKAVETNIYTGAHGFEQWNRDIYRSLYVYGKIRRDAHKLWGRWQLLAEEDPDYSIMQYAHKKGMNAPTSPVHVDLREDLGFGASPFAQDPKAPLAPDGFETLVEMYNQSTEAPYGLG